jgi:hypothetical protein
MAPGGIIGRPLSEARQMPDVEDLRHQAQMVVAEREARVPSPAQSGQRDVASTWVTNTANQ